mmetsp:Transcript_98911/g.284200  ORF Transcript_98911/g.284200 Transcript_98911/m.284200 type:complete len:335 (+) Transcript_98911:1428-2432(+)
MKHRRGCQVSMQDCHTAPKMDSLPHMNDVSGSTPAQSTPSRLQRSSAKSVILRDHTDSANKNNCSSARSEDTGGAAAWKVASSSACAARTLDADTSMRAFSSESIMPSLQAAARIHINACVSRSRSYVAPWMTWMNSLCCPLNVSDKTQSLTMQMLSLKSVAQASKCLNIRRVRPQEPKLKVSHQAPSMCACDSAIVPESESIAISSWNLFAERCWPHRYVTAPSQISVMDRVKVFMSSARKSMFRSRTRGMHVAVMAIKPPSTDVTSTTKYSVNTHCGIVESEPLSTPSDGFIKFIIQYTCQLSPNNIVFLADLEIKYKNTTKAKSIKHRTWP